MALKRVTISIVPKVLQSRRYVIGKVIVKLLYCLLRADYFYGYLLVVENSKENLPLLVLYPVDTRMFT
jgi:hypothetical protein